MILQCWRLSIEFQLEHTIWKHAEQLHQRQVQCNNHQYCILCCMLQSVHQMAEQFAVSLLPASVASGVHVQGHAAAKTELPQKLKPVYTCVD